MKRKGMDKKLLKRILIYVGIFFICIAYLLWVRKTHLGIPCLFYLITGWKCPGCGITRMCYHIFFLEFREAYEANAYLCVTLPFLIVMSVKEIVRRKTHGKVSVVNQMVLYLYIAGLLIFGVLRNIYCF